MIEPTPDWYVLWVTVAIAAAFAVPWAATTVAVAHCWTKIAPYRATTVAVFCEAMIWSAITVCAAVGFLWVLTKL